MDPFFIGLGLVAFCLLLGLVAGARSGDTSARTGGLTGLFLGLMAAFPLLAIGLANAG